MEAARPGEHRSRMLDGLRSARADAQNLLMALDKIEKAGALTDATARQAQTSAAVQQGLRLLERRNLNEHWQSIELARQSDPSLGARWGDALEAILNAIEDLPGAWPKSTDAGQALAEVKEARSTLLEIIVEAAKLSIPSRLKEHLAQRSTGRPFDFNASFKDELPDPEIRKAYLRELKEYEGESFNGVVDVDAGLIYVTSRSRLNRILTYFAPAISAAALGGLLYGVSLLSIDWPIADGKPLIQGYVLVLLGMVAHLLIENAKQFDMGDKIVVVGDKLTWMHLRWASLSWSIVPAAVTAVGLRFGNLPGADDWQTYLFAGYAADSIAGLFLTRYDASAKKGLEALKGAVAPKAVKAASGAGGP